MTTVMLFVGGLFLGGVYAFGRQKRWLGVGICLAASLLAFASAWAWSGR
jgi:hypothetical protein